MNSTPLPYAGTYQPFWYVPEVYQNVEVLPELYQRDLSIPMFYQNFTRGTLLETDDHIVLPELYQKDLSITMYYQSYQNCTRFLVRTRIYQKQKLWDIVKYPMMQLTSCQFKMAAAWTVGDWHKVVSLSCFMLDTIA